MVPARILEFGTVPILFHALSQGRYPPLGSLGSNWEEGLEEALACLQRIVRSRRAGSCLAVSDVSALRRAFEAEGISYRGLRRRTGCLGGLLNHPGPSRENRQPAAHRHRHGRPKNGLMVLVNPFFANLQPETIRQSMRLYQRENTPVVSVRTPPYHPLLFRERRYNPKHGGRYTERIPCDAWRCDSFYIYIDGRPFQFRRQNYPDVVAYCGAVIVATRGQLGSLAQRLKSGDFAPYRLPDEQSYDFSHRLERLRAEAIEQNTHHAVAGSL